MNYGEPEAYGPPQGKTDSNPEISQVGVKTQAARRRVRSGEGTLAYWRAKLFRNTYRDREGKTVEIPEYYVRMRYDGVSKRVRLHSSDREKAAEEALGLFERVLEEGWNAVERRQARIPGNISIAEYIEA